MADDKKKKPVLVKFPKGTFVWPKLNEADTKFKKEGEFVTRVAVTREVAQPFMDKIDQLAAATLEEAKANAKNAKEAKQWAINNSPYEIEVDEDDNETGTVIFKFNRTASGVSKKTGKPWSIKRIPQFDAKGRPLPEKLVAGNGTIGIVSFSYVPYAPNAKIGTGVKLGLEAVQILDLKEFGGGRDAGAYGFGEEDGYDVQDESEDEDKSEGEGEEAGAEDDENF